jgi:hypothetical protein
MLRTQIPAAIAISVSLACCFAIADEPETYRYEPNHPLAIKEGMWKGYVQVDHHEVRREAATKEYASRIAEFEAGKSPVNVVIQSNNRLLHASLCTGAPNAAVEYDRRASRIEGFAQKNLDLGVGTIQEVALAKSARLDAMLKDLLVRPASNNN